jgi:uncharacterized membrane protein YkoI
MDKSQKAVPRFLVVAAIVAGVALGSYGIAAAASGSGSSSTSTTTTAAPSTAATPAQAPPGATTQDPWGHQRSDETLLTGDTATKVQQAAVAKVGSGATVIRVETDAEGHAPYEVHMVNSDGTPTTVYVDKQFKVVSVETR